MTFCPTKAAARCKLDSVISRFGPRMRSSCDRLDMYIRARYHCIYVRRTMAVTMTSIRLDTDLADEAVKVLKAKSRTDAIHIALREIVGLKRFKALMKKNSGKLKFSGLDE
jgi:Arc/MetJ family transcription regulator